MLLIGFGHKARQGKNTAAVALLNAMPVDCRARIYAYADALRREVRNEITRYGSVAGLLMASRYRADERRIPDWVIDEGGGKPRTLLQWWGTNYRRAQDPLYWVKRLQVTLDQEQPDAALITDVRFPNEADAIHERGGYVVKVTRTGKLDIDVHAHESEQAMDDYTGWDYELTAATLPELRKKAADHYTKIARRK